MFVDFRERKRMRQRERWRERETSMRERKVDWLPLNVDQITLE